MQRGIEEVEEEYGGEKDSAKVKCDAEKIFILFLVVGAGSSHNVSC